MSIKPLNPHYSFESVPSVYDEEAMTALEMCGRLGKKVNEVITAVNGWNVPQIVNVSPTGDKTGELDRVVIQGKLDAGYAVHLSAGEYYLNNPLIFRAGYMLRGDSQLNTVLNCKAGFIDHENTVSVDHVEVRDIRVKGPDGGLGIDISRKVQGLETGGRYAHFMNVYITGYDTAVRLGGCWCTNFTHCRIEAKEICVEQRGSCNHVKYDHCMFLGPVDEKTSIGVKITAEQGSENYGISFNHCEFERHNIAVQAYYCVALNVFALYVEGVNTVFSLDSCPAFLCDGGYISYPERVCNTSRTNTAKVFSKCTGTIKNLYVKVNYSAEPFYFASTNTNAPLDISNIDCVNDGTEVCYTDAQIANSQYNGVSLMDLYRVDFTNVDLTQNTNFIDKIPFFINGKQAKIVNVETKILSGFTNPKKAAFSISLDNTGNHSLITTINAGDYTAGQIINASVNPDHQGRAGYTRLIAETPPKTVKIQNYTPVSVSGVKADISVYIYFGDMIL